MKMDNIGNTEHALTFAALRVHYYTGRSCLISGEGRNKVFGYRHGVMTDIGDLPEAEWTRLAKQLIRQSGEQELYQQLFAWGREQSHWEQSPSQFELDVLSLHMTRLPDNPAWCDFIPFNRKYRPEVLCNAEILWVKCSGCGKPHEMTGTQLKNIRDRIIIIKFHKSPGTLPGSSSLSVFISIKVRAKIYF